jgi:hypothetical protein
LRPAKGLRFAALINAQHERGANSQLLAAVEIASFAAQKNPEHERPFVGQTWQFASRELTVATLA